MSDRPLVFVCEPIAPAARAWLGERVDVRDGPPSESGAREADALVLRTHTVVDDDLLAVAGRLRVVARAGAGLDNVDVAACRARGIEVVYAPEANTQAVVEYTITILTDALRPRTRVQQGLDPAAWADLRSPTLASRQMDTLVLGILGCGRIGRRVSEIAQAIGFDVCYCDLLDVPHEARGRARPVDLQTLFATADVVSIHVDGRSSNRDLVDAVILMCMKPDVTLLNTSRGFVVDNLALAAFLQQHPAAHAHLDVHEPEPVPPDHPLLGLSNAWLYPHLAARTHSALDAMSWVVRDVVAVLDGQPPRFPAPDQSTPVNE